MKWDWVALLTALGFGAILKGLIDQGISWWQRRRQDDAAVEKTKLELTEERWETFLETQTRAAAEWREFLTGELTVTRQEVVSLRGEVAACRQNHQDCETRLRLSEEARAHDLRVLREEFEAQLRELRKPRLA